MVLIEDGEPDGCSHVRDLIADKLKQVKEKIAGLRRTEKRLAKHQERCSTALKRSCGAQCPKSPEIGIGTGERIKVKVEVLYFKGCPNHKTAVEQVRKALRSEGLAMPVDEVEITDPAMAQRVGSLGSPSIRFDGIDVEPGAREIKTFGFGCRTYSDDEGRRSGMPTVGLIQRAARERRSA